MTSNKKESLISVSIIILLGVQVVLSFGVIHRLNNLVEKVTKSAGQIEQNAPSYIENISTDDDPILGVKEAPIAVVGFLDYECPACAQAMGKVKETLTRYEGKVLFVYRDFPLEHIHPHAFQAAEAAHCAGDQGKFWEMQDILFGHSSQLDTGNLKQYAKELNIDVKAFNKCLDQGKYTDEVQHDIEDGMKYSVTATPTFFVNGYRIIGVETLDRMIDQVLASGG